MARRRARRDPFGMNSTSPQNSPRSLNRSTTDRKLAGVSGGLATYLGVDPVLIRVGFVVTTLASGVGLLAYLALLALVPADDAVAGEALAGA
jgi:phage shock protein C